MTKQIHRFGIARIGLLLLAITGCSTTPGDAALRGAHYPQAAELYEAGAAQGDPLAARKLADLYNFEPGLPTDQEKAVYWYKKSIELGDVPSYWFVGVIYRDGSGNVPRDYGQAEQYFLLGAQKGHHYAMYDLAGMYAQQNTKSPNDIDGLKWITIVTTFATACPSTNEGCQYVLRDPKKVRETLESRMTADQKQKAEELAHSWVDQWNEQHK